MTNPNFTWKYVKQLPQVDDVELHSPEVTGHENNRYLVCLHDWASNPVTGGMGNTFYSESPRDALEQLGHY